MKRIFGLFLVGASLLSVYSCGENKKQESTQADTTASSEARQKELPQKEKDFLMDAAKGTMLEAQLGKLASEKASSKEVKAFAQLMVSEIQQTKDKIQQVAASNNIVLPDSLERKEQKEIEDLANLSGAEFDKKFMNKVVKDHKEDLSNFEDMAEKAENPEVKNMAQQTLPTLRDHYTKAQQLEEMVSKENKNSKKTSLK